jgi:N-acetylglucosamine-6-phosphate deacetylase
MRTLIKNVRIIKEHMILDNHQLIIEDNIIKEIIHNDTNAQHIDTVIDGHHQYLSPGWIDIHNHGNSGYDTMDATPKALEKMAEFHLSNGVTSFLAATMTNPIDKIKDAVKNVSDYINHQTPLMSTCLGVYLEGPYFNIIKKGAQPGKDIRNPDIKQLKELIANSNQQIKVVSLAPELDGAMDMIHFLKDQGIAVAVGHSNAVHKDTFEAIQNGASLATHLYNGMSAFSHREPGIVGAALTNDSLRTEVIADGIHLHKTAIDIAKRCKTSDGIVLISDAMRAAGLEDGTYELGGQTVISENGFAKLTDGTLAGSTLNLNKAVKNMVHLFDTPIIDAVKMASTNPAKAINVYDTIGSIDINKQADLILFDDEIKISKIIKNGHVIPLQ